MKQSQKIVINPEIAHAVVKRQLSDVCFIYLLARAASKRAYSNNGLFSKSEFIQIISTLLSLSRQQSYVKIKKGNNIFWHDHGKGKIQLISFEKVLENIQPELRKSKPMLFDMRDLMTVHWDSSLIQAFFVGVVASRFSVKRPIAFAELCSSLALSESTIKRCLKICPFLIQESNYAIILSTFSKKEANNYKDKLKYISFLCKRADGLIEVMQQLPNSYVMSNTTQLSFKQRHQLLKHRDSLHEKEGIYKPFYIYQKNVDNIKEQISSIWATEDHVRPQKDYNKRVYLWRK